MKKILPSVVSALILAALILPTQVHLFAQLKANPPDTTTQNPGSSVSIGIDNPFRGAGNCTSQGADCLYNFIETLVSKLILPAGSIIAVCMFIWTGFMFVSAQGNSAKIAKAKQSLIYTAIGTAILLGAWVIAEVIKTTINELTTAASQ
jgi:hypothetical protein